MADQAALHRILSTLGHRTGMWLPRVRHEELEKAVARMITQGHERSFSRLARRLERGEIDLAPLLEQIRVGETYFFRHPEHFEFLRAVAVPDLLSRIGDRTLQFWSAGCASGEEAYSIAILLDQMGLRARSNVIGTDISASALESARTASYGEWSFRGGARDHTRGYFETHGARRVLREPIRSDVVFRQLNLACDEQEWAERAPTGVDVIFLRNVLIYFNQATVRRVARRLFTSLLPGGWLITAAADPLLDQFAPFEATLQASGVYLRRPLEARADSNESKSSVHAAAPDVRPDAVRSRPERRRSSEVRSVPESHSEESQQDLISAAAGAMPSERLEQLARLAAEDPSSVDVQFALAISQMELGRDDDATDSIRRVLYIDRGLALAHFVHALLLGRRGDVAGAERALLRSESICESHAPDERVPPDFAMHYDALQASIRDYGRLIGRGRSR